MPTVTTYSEAQNSLSSLCDEVVSTREAVIIKRRKAEDVALIAADELESLMETVHLMRSPKNAQRFLAALTRTQSQELASSPIDELREALGLVSEEGSVSECNED